MEKLKSTLRQQTCIIYFIMSNPQGFGRPQDKDIEKQFMKKIRGDKLQAINAECQLQICLAFLQGKKQKKKPSKPEGNKITFNQLAMLQIGNNIAEREVLIQKFGQYKESWKFQEIQDGDPLPEFFFDDGCDLSYILYNLQKDLPEKYSKFKAQQLLFLEFLCLQGRGHLNNSILDYYKAHMNYLIDAMNAGLQKIQLRLTAISKASNEPKIDTEEVMIGEDEENNFENSQQIEKNSKSNKKQKGGKKTKQIGKGSKSKKKKGKGRKSVNSDSGSEDQEGQMAQEVDYPKEKELAIKTCNYISWAYWYIIKK